MSWSEWKKFSGNNSPSFCGYAEKYYDNANTIINTIVIQEDVFTNDTDNRKIICNKKGKYAFVASFHNIGSNNTTGITVYKNSEVVGTLSVPANKGSIIQTYTIDLKVGDYIQIYKNNAGNGTVGMLLLYEE